MSLMAKLTSAKTMELRGLISNPFWFFSITVFSTIILYEQVPISRLTPTKLASIGLLNSPELCYKLWLRAVRHFLCQLRGLSKLF